MVYSFSSDPEGEWKNYQRILKFLPQTFGSETSNHVDNFFIAPLVSKKIRVDSTIIAAQPQAQIKRSNEYISLHLISNTKMLHFDNKSIFFVFLVFCPPNRSHPYFMPGIHNFFVALKNGKLWNGSKKYLQFSQSFCT